jgi:hypothetical protein
MSGAYQSSDDKSTIEENQPASRAKDISPPRKCVRENSFSGNRVIQRTRIQPAKRAGFVSPARKRWVKWNKSAESRRDGTVLTHTRKCWVKRTAKPFLAAAGDVSTSRPEAVKSLLTRRSPQPSDFNPKINFLKVSYCPYPNCYSRNRGLAEAALSTFERRHICPASAVMGLNSFVFKDQTCKYCKLKDLAGQS